MASSLHRVWHMVLWEERNNKPPIIVKMENTILMPITYPRSCICQWGDIINTHKTHYKLHLRTYVTILWPNPRTRFQRACVGGIMRMRTRGTQELAREGRISTRVKQKWLSLALVSLPPTALEPMATCLQKHWQIPRHTPANCTSFPVVCSLFNSSLASGPTQALVHKWKNHFYKMKGV